MTGRRPQAMGMTDVRRKALAMLVARYDDPDTGVPVVANRTSLRFGRLSVPTVGDLVTMGLARLSNPSGRYVLLTPRGLETARTT